MNFSRLKRQIERCISRLSSEYHLTPASILTESDLKSRLQHLLTHLSVSRCRSVASRHQALPVTAVHSDLSWFDENHRLRIRPDITILEPEHLRTRYSLHQVFDPFSGGGYRFRRGERLPSKQFGFTGNTITLELKFARNGIDKAMAKLILKDFQKMNRLFRLLDDRGEGDPIFSYLVIFNSLNQPPWHTPLAEFFEQNKSSARHRILYKTWRPSASRSFRFIGTKRSALNGWR